jgi:hypothetical protein
MLAVTFATALAAAEARDQPIGWNAALLALVSARRPFLARRT